MFVFGTGLGIATKTSEYKEQCCADSDSNYGFDTAVVFHNNILLKKVLLWSCQSQ